MSDEICHGDNAERVARNVRARQLRLLYEQGSLTLLGVMINALFLAFLFRELAPATLIGVWLGVTSLTYFIRYLLSRRYRRLSDEQLQTDRWIGYFTLGTLISGLLWGGFGAVLLDYATPMHLGLLVIILGGMSAASIATYATVRGLSAAFIVPAMLPITLRLLSGDGELNMVMGILLLLFIVILLSSAERSYQSAIVGMRLAEEQGQQAEASEVARQRSEELVGRLEREVEERRVVEHSLRQSQSRFENAQRITGFGHWEWNLQNHAIWWSENMFLISGRDPEHFTPSAENFVELIHPDDSEEMQRSLKSVLDGHSVPINYRLIRPDGEVRHIHAEGELIYDGWGNPAYMTGIAHDVTEQVRAEEELRRSEHELSNILTNLQDTFYRTNLEGEVVYITPQIEKAMGYTPEEMLGMKMSELYVAPGERERFLAELQAGGGEIRNWIAPLRHKDGSVVWGSANAHFYRDDEGNIAGVEGITRDITKLKQAEAALQREQQLALVTLESIGDGVLTTDLEGCVEYLNPVAEQLIGEGVEAVSRHYSEVLPLVEEDSGEPLDDLVELSLHHAGGFVNASNGLLQRADGSEFVFKVSTAAMRDTEGQVIGAVLVLHDITETMAMTRQLNYQANHDTLTGLVNRREFQRRLEQAVLNARECGCEHSLLYMDLDQFKVVNDTCGHRAGDELLKQLALQLDDTTRDSDTVARLGGDEFAVLLERCPMERAREIAEALRQRVKEFRFVWEDKSFEIGVSIGAVAIGKESGDIEQLLSAADAACYFAKEQGRNRVFVYNIEDGISIQRHGEMSWVHRITEAFEQERFCLDGQLIAPLEASDEPPHYEVLLRMRNEEGALIPPMAFIPAAERYNLMPTIDRWVVRTTLARLRDAQGEAQQPPIACSINLSGQTLADDHFLDFVIEQLESSGIPAEFICFEVTETAAITNLTRAMKFIGELKRRGCLFSLDDFGSGLSSFGYLKNLPVDYLKIDGAFVKDILIDEIDEAMVKAIHEVGSVMQLRTIAEFVENDEIAERLKAIGVDYAQGYGVARPEPLNGILERYSV